jgi:hypothetical protein
MMFEQTVDELPASQIRQAAAAGDAARSLRTTMQRSISGGEAIAAGVDADSSANTEKMGIEMWCVLIPPCKGFTLLPRFNRDCLYRHPA